MKHLLTEDIDGANWGRIVATGEGDNAKVLLKGFDLGFLPYKLVDLGLSVKWADRNLGASSPEDAGLYFQWGDTQGYTADQCGSGEGQKAFASDFSDYKFYENENFTKYTEAKKGVVLESTDDAAIAETKTKLRMPTQSDMEELFNPEKTTMKWVVQTRATVTDSWSEKTEIVVGDVNTSGMVFDENTGNFIEEDSTKKFLGVRFYGKGEYASNSIFVPAAGFCGDGALRSCGYDGYLWSSSLYAGDAVGAVCGYFNAGGYVSVDGGYRFFGLSVRGVAAAQ